MDSMNLLPKGECPWCKEDVRAEPHEENAWPKRDVYKCPECEGLVLKCYTLGCDDVARWGKYWDHYYCPSCTRALGPLASIGKILGLGRKLPRKAR